MKKKILVVVGIIVLAVGISNVVKKCEPNSISKFRCSSISYSQTQEKPTFVNAYIDASGSMKGYFSVKSDSRFIDALSNAHPNKTMWMDEEYTELSEIPTNELLTKNFRGKDSRFDIMLPDIIKHDSLSISGGVSLLFTDGILSASKSQTDTNPEFMRQSFGSFKNAIAESFKDISVAVALFKLESMYNGTYWNYMNKPVDGLTVQDRPFYIIALGKPAQLRHFIANNSLNAKLNAVFGVYGKNEENNKKGFLSEENNEKGFLSPISPKDWNGYQFKGDTIGFCLTLPDYVAAMGSGYVMENLVVKLDTSDVTAKLRDCVSVTNKNFTIDNWAKNDISKPILVPGEHTLTIEVRKSLSKGWSDLYSEDDTDIKNYSNEQTKTFALQYLLQGIQEGLEPNEAVIFSSSIIFSK